MLPMGYHCSSCCHEKHSCLQSVGIWYFLKIEGKEKHCFKHHHPLTLIILCFRHSTRCCVMYFFSLFQQTSDPSSSKCNTSKNVYCYVLNIKVLIYWDRHKKIDSKCSECPTVFQADYSYW